ncbi:MAG: hypothetical protein M3N18_02060 [Actinomycetota bacterium]|nr:hypothetical protein [Actinomycetota bacterium]
MAELTMPDPPTAGLVDVLSVGCTWGRSADAVSSTVLSPLSNASEEEVSSAVPADREASSGGAERATPQELRNPTIKATTIVITLLLKPHPLEKS